MTKEEIIKKAWGLDYHNYIREDGWSIKKPEDSNICLFEVKIEGCTDILPFDSSRSIYRPKSIKGIENNNGWIKIESEADLPEIGTYCHFIIKGFEELNNQGLFDGMFWDNKSAYTSSIVTHYQPIEKPKPPIY